jgi:hypothetical protein
VIDEEIEIREENKARAAREEVDGLPSTPARPMEILGADDWAIYAADANDRVFYVITESWPEWLALPDDADQEPHSVVRYMIPLLRTGKATFAGWQRVDARWEEELPRQLAQRWLRHQLVVIAEDRSLAEHPDWFTCQDALDQTLSGGQCKAGDLESRPMLDDCPAEHHPSCALGLSHPGVCQRATGLALPPLRDVSQPLGCRPWVRGTR